MTKQALNFQDSFLNQMRKEGQEIKVVLTNGSSLIGVVKGFDNFTVMLQSRNGQHLIYKHAVAQMIARSMERRAMPDKEQTPANMTNMSEEKVKSEEQSPKTPPKNRDSFNAIDVSKINVV